MALKKYIKKLLRMSKWTKPVTFGINSNGLKNQKKVLLCYLNYETVMKENEKHFKSSNYVEILYIIRAFIALDFSIDVCAANDERVFEVVDSSKYDYILGFGSVFRKMSENTNACKIIYMTENPYIISKNNAKERMDYFYERHGRRISQYSRTGTFYKEHDEENADIVICLGEEGYYSKPTYRLFPSGLFNKNFRFKFFSDSECTEAKKCFIVYGTTGVVHKGIDLLVDIFKEHLDWTLIICGDNTSGKLKDIGISLSNNIVDMGYVDTESDLFLNLVNRCAFIVLPSCSEASTTGVLTGMRHGLIPIITKNNGFEKCGEVCLFFDDFHLENIEKKILDVIDWDCDMVNSYRYRVFEYANKHFSINSFSDSMLDILKTIISNE